MVGRGKSPQAFGWLKEGEKINLELPVRAIRSRYANWPLNPDLADAKLHARMGREMLDRWKAATGRFFAIIGVSTRTGTGRSWRPTARARAGPNGGGR